MKKNIAIILLLFCFGIQEAHCAVLTMEEAIATGILNNPQIQSERKKIGISNADVKEAGLFINPRIILDGAFAENSYKGGIEQTIELGGKRKKRIAAAKIDREIVAQQIAGEIINMRSEIRNAYIDLYTARERLKTAQEILILTERLTQIAQKQQSAGQIAMLDVMQAEIINIKAKSDIQTSYLEECKAFNELKNKMGTTLSYDIELLKPDPDKDFAELKRLAETSDDNKAIQTLIDMANENRPELKRLEKSIEKTRQMEKLAKVSSIPDLTFSAGPNILVEKEEKTLTKVNIFASIDMELPIFNHGQAAVMRAKAQREVLTKQLEAAKNQAALEINNIYYEILRKNNSLKIYESELLPKASDILKKSELSFQEGKSSILTPLNSQAAFIDIKKGYINTLENYYKALNNLEKAIGANNENI